MNSIGLVVFFVSVAAASAGLIAGVRTPALIPAPLAPIVRSQIAPGHILGLHGGIVAPRAVIAPGLRILAPAGSGLEGQWIPDINEKLYDDGTYKPYIYGH